MDTVSPVEGWESDPFKPRLEGDKIIGLGSNDAGASVVTLIATYQKMQLIWKDHLNLLLLISAEEEVSGANGISAVLQFNWEIWMQLLWVNPPECILLSQNVD